jgi:transposase
VINQLRGFLLEHGIAVRQGHRFLRQQLPRIVATRTDVLSPRMFRILGDLVEDWAHLDERIEKVTDEIEGLAPTDVSCGRTALLGAAGERRGLAPTPFPRALNSPKPLNSAPPASICSPIKRVLGSSPHCFS